MPIKILPSNLPELGLLRDLFLQENCFQFICNKCHVYGWADHYLIVEGEQKIGYGAVWGQEKREDRDAIFEFFLIKPFRKFANDIFPKLIAASGTTYVESQSNDSLLTAMLYEHCKDINAEAILFEDFYQTNFLMEGTMIEKKLPDSNNVNDYPFLLKHNEALIGTGGLMLNYNLPYADIYYEIDVAYRNKGYGTFMVQELKKEAYKMGRGPQLDAMSITRYQKAFCKKQVFGFAVIG